MSFWEAVVSYYTDLNLVNLPLSDPSQLIWLILALYLGVVLAMAAAFLVRRRLGAVVDALMTRGACTPETAVTAAEGGFDRPMQLRELRRGKMLRKTIVALLPEGQELPETPETPEQLATLRFYLPEERRKELEKRFSSKGNRIRSFLLSFLLVTVGAVLVYFLLAPALQLIDNAITSFRG